jgi:adenylate cyclase
VSTEPDRIERKLAAIFAADVAGYSRLMERDEAGTLRALTTHREVMDRLIGEHRGRIANTAGDSVLAEFPSVVDAVQCAVEVQKGLADLSEGITPEKALRFRIGIHVGDVMVRGDDLLGDGVNIAVRLEGLAEPGGVCISSDAYRQIRKALPLTLTDLGPQQVKNLEEPVHAFAWAPSPATASVGFAPLERRPLPIPDKPSIAVLPFAKIGGQPDSDFLGDGVVEEITAALSRVRSFLVIAHNSAAAYKGRTVDLPQVSRELGVRYVVEGSVRRAGTRVRITAKLIDAPTGSTLWAEHYDGNVEDVFDLQDRITASIVGAIQPSIRLAEIERAKRKRPDNLDAYDLVMRALPHVWTLERDGNRTATQILQEALRLDPYYPTALALAAWCSGQRVLYSWSHDPASEKQETLRLAQEAAALSSDDAFVLTVLGAALSLTLEFRRAETMLERALALDPNLAFAWSRSGWLKTYRGEAEWAIQDFERALRLSPFDPMASNWFMGIGCAHFIAGRYEQSMEWQEKALFSNPAAVWMYRGLIPAYVFAGEMDKARAGLQHLLQAYPGLTLSQVREALSFAEDYTDRMIEGLRQAGLPE